MQWKAGRRVKKRKPEYIGVDEDIMREKLKFQINIGRIFAYVFPHESAWPAVDIELMRYLNVICHLIGV